MYGKTSTQIVLDKALLTAFALTALIGVGAAQATPRSTDKPWTVTLGPAQMSDKSILATDIDKKKWVVELYDAVACQKMSSVTLGTSPTTIHVYAREGVADPRKPHEFGGHFRWRVQGTVPFNGAHTKMWFEGEGTPMRDKAGPFPVVIYPPNGVEKKVPTIDGNCEK
jgi:hypothetical protein